MADAARMLPVAGIILLLLPLLRLGGDGSDAARTSQVGLYIFAVWVALMAVALGLSRGLHEEADREDQGPTSSLDEGPRA